MLQKLKTPFRWWLGVVFLSAGIGHFVSADFFLEIMPEWIPFHEACVYLSGIAEISLGTALQIPKFRRQAAWGIIALLVVVFPVNINMALTGQTQLQHAPDFLPPISEAGLWVRLPIQFILMAWAWWYTREETAAESPAEPPASGA
ncbi:MAG: DoxX family membrane protein [Chrysiogenetes bacterium]|nr:DoxX family membrane protein [Chrysiogenetes bacterium]